MIDIKLKFSIIKLSIVYDSKVTMFFSNVAKQNLKFSPSLIIIDNNYRNKNTNIYIG